MPQRAVNLVALLVCVYTFGVAYAGILPWITLKLEGREVAPVPIGVVSAANAIGVMVMAPFAGRIVRRMGMANGLLYWGLMSVVMLGLLPVFESVTGWIVLRFVGGLAGAVPWIVTETWINMIAGEQSRARVIALYAIALAAGFATGPVVLTLTGTQGLLPVATFLFISLVALVPIVFIRRNAPELGADEGGDIWGAITAMPTVMLAVFVAGAVDASFFSFLPIWGTRAGFEPAHAVTLLSIFVAGNIVLQFPIGWLADRIGPRKTMALSGLVCLAAPFLALPVVASHAWLAGVLFIWGGAAWSLYALALVEIGHRLTGTALATANGAIVLVYTLSNIAAPPVSGAAMQLWDPHGFLFISSIASVILLAVLTFRSLAMAKT